MHNAEQGEMSSVNNGYSEKVQNALSDSPRQGSANNE